MNFRLQGINITDGAHSLTEGTTALFSYYTGPVLFANNSPLRLLKATWEKRLHFSLTTDRGAKWESMCGSSCPFRLFYSGRNSTFLRPLKGPRKFGALHI
jgi:hypothetical protein